VLSKSGGVFTILQLNQYTIPEVQAYLIAIDEHIKSLCKSAPELRLQHLCDRKSDAETKGDSKAIIRCEHLRDRFKEVNRTNRVRKGGGNVFKVEKRELDGTITSTEFTVAPVLHLQQGMAAPCSPSSLIAITTPAPVCGL
jgi:hypothetical protein